MYISIYQDVDAVNPAKIGAEVSVNSTVDGNYQTRMVSKNPVGRNVILLPKLFRPTVRKIVLKVRKNCKQFVRFWENLQRDNLLRFLSDL